MNTVKKCFRFPVEIIWRIHKLQLTAESNKENKTLDDILMEVIYKGLRDYDEFSKEKQTTLIPTEIPLEPFKVVIPDETRNVLQKLIKEGKYTSFAQALYPILQAQHGSIRSIADQIDIGPQTFSNFLKGTNPPSMNFQKFIELLTLLELELQ